jgi:hypothetical protein
MIATSVFIHRKRCTWLVSTPFTMRSRSVCIGVHPWLKKASNGDHIDVMDLIRVHPWFSQAPKGAHTNVLVLIRVHPCPSVV